jgi:AcrR family transcriptional regulator
LTVTQAHARDDRDDDHDDREPRITPRRAATRQRLLTAATTVIAERGVNGASVEAICEEAGFTRGAFYSNFSTKEDLLNALMEHKHEALLDGIRRILQEAGHRPTPEGVEVIDDLVEKVLAANPVDRESRLMETEISLYMIRNPDLAPQLQTTMAPFREELLHLVVAGLDRAGRRLSVDREDALNAIFAGYESGTTRMMISAASGQPDPRDGLDTCRQILALVIKAISEPDPASRTVLTR